MQPNSQQARDVAYQLHPYTNARSHQEAGPLIIERGKGSYVFDTAGNRYLDAMAGLWSVGLGFSEKRLIEAASHGMKRVHVTLDDLAGQRVDILFPLRFGNGPHWRRLRNRKHEQQAGHE